MNGMGMGMGIGIDIDMGLGTTIPESRGKCHHTQPLTQTHSRKKIIIKGWARQQTENRRTNEHERQDQNERTSDGMQAGNFSTKLRHRKSNWSWLGDGVGAAFRVF